MKDSEGFLNPCHSEKSFNSYQPSAISLRSLGEGDYQPFAPSPVPYLGMFISTENY